MSYPVKVFATTGSDGLADEVCQALQQRLPIQLQPQEGITLSRPKVERFSNENLEVQVDNVRGRFVVVIHTQVPPVNEHLIELFALLDAINDARAADVLLVFPYMPYARSDRKNKPRISTMGHRLPRILTAALDVRRVILLDPHDTHTKHYFEPAADEISAIYLLVDYLEKKFLSSAQDRENNVVVFADAGSAKRYELVAHLLKLPIAYIDKDRPDDTESPEFKQVIGKVGGKRCFLIDDEILTGGTSIGDANILLEGGASSVIMSVIHAPLASQKLTDAEIVGKLEESPIERFVITNSIPVEHKLPDKTKFVVLSVAPLLAEAISRTVQDGSLTDLHKRENVRLYRS